MTSLRIIALASVSFLSIVTPALAQNATQSPTDSSTSVTTINEIVVDARRRSERLQDVPKSIEVVSSSDLQKNAITNFQDIAQLTSGLTLQNGNNGLVVNTKMRGVSFDVNSGANSTVAFYWNDGGAQANYVYQAMYDIGQIEVQKGPQGTLRGAAAPSGAITITTHAPDLYRLSGFAEGSIGTDFYGHTVDGALNIPVIEGKLAVRLAGMLTDTDGYGARSADPATFPIKPYSRSWSGRVSVRYLPTDNLDINLVYQRTAMHQLNYEQTQSTCLFNTTACADPGNDTSWYGVISADQRLSTVSEARTISRIYDAFNLRANWHILGQKLSYVGQYSISHLFTTNPNDYAGLFSNGYYSRGGAFTATGNLYTQGFNDINTAKSRGQYETNEIRLSSEERIKGIFDYTIGFYAMWSPTNNDLGNRPSAVASYAGPGLDAVLAGMAANTLTKCNVMAASQSVACGAPNLQQFGKRTEQAVFGNITAHLLQDKLELSGGLRQLWDRNIACFLGDSHTVQLMNSLPGGCPDAKTSKLIWTASASYRFAPGVMGYVSGGSSFRQGMNSVGPLASSLAGGGIDPETARAFGQMKDETSTSIEVGIKTQFARRRGYFNLTYYHQNFHNFQWSAPSFVWVETNTGGPMSINGFVASVPVKVDGVEIEAGYRFSRELDFGGTFSYANGRIVNGGLTPCNGPNGAGSVSAEVPIVTCAGGPASFVPRWSIALHGDYTRRLDAARDGYLRVQGSISPASLYNVSVPADRQRPYSIFNLFVGAKAHNGDWDLSLFVKNIFKNQTILSTYGGNIPTVTSMNGMSTPSAYSFVSITPPRQFGAQLRVAFGK